MNNQLESQITHAADIICNARYAIALTGAGHSTPSGIPDFRSPGTGMWEQVDPMEVASIHAFRHQPEVFYRWVQPIVETLHNAQPNPGHMALARLEEAGKLKAVITQNIDGLHQKAGSRTVLEVHGHLREMTCLDCYHTEPSDRALKEVLAGKAPRCVKCGGVVKPDVVLFGEQLPADVLISTMEHVRRADVILVAGSSLLVMPIARVPYLVHESGGKVIIVNNQSTYADEFAEVVLHHDLAEVLPQMVRACVGNWK